MPTKSILFDDFKNDFQADLSTEKVAELLSDFEQKQQNMPENERTETQAARQKLQDAIKKHPKLTAQLYQIKKNTKQDKHTFAKLAIDDENTPYLKIYKQMDGGFFDFDIHDGKVVFNGTMDEAHIAEIIDFLYRRGITNFELPKGLDEKKIEAYRKGNKAALTQAENREAHDVHIQIPQAYNEEKLKITPWKNPEKKDYKDFDKAENEFETWLGAANQRKVEGLSYWKHGGILSNTVEFSVYDSQDVNNYKNDGKRDKDGNIKETCAYRLSLHRKKGKLDSIGYHIPKNGKLSDPLADKIVELAKNQGANVINFPQGLAPDEAGVFRMSCARFGLVPMGISISELHAKKMIDTAAGALDEKALLEYKYKLALQMEKNTNGDPGHRAANKIQDLKNEYMFKPLKDKMEGVLNNELNDRINGGKAEEVIGAAKSMRELFDIYDAAKNSTVQALLNSGLIDEASKKRFIKTMHENNISPDEKLMVRDMSNEQMKALFNALEVKNTKEAARDLQQEIDENPEETPNRLVSEKVRAAYDLLNKDLSKQFKNRGLDGFDTNSFGKPKFKHYTSENNNRSNNSHNRRNHNRNRSNQAAIGRDYER